MWQSFAAISRGTSEMWLPKKTSAVKQKPVRNYRSGRPNNNSVTTQFLNNLSKNYYDGYELLLLLQERV